MFGVSVRPASVWLSNNVVHAAAVPFSSGVDCFKTRPRAEHAFSLTRAGLETADVSDSMVSAEADQALWSHILKRSILEDVSPPAAA